MLKVQRIIKVGRIFCFESADGLLCNQYAGFLAYFIRNGDLFMLYLKLIVVFLIENYLGFHFLLSVINKVLESVFLFASCNACSPDYGRV